MEEIGGIIILGIFAQWLAWRLKVPAILPLIITGLAVGPFFEMMYGQKFIEPMWNSETGHGLYPGETLFHFVELAIGIILFEGGLTLKRKELQGVGDTIFKLISIGAIVTFIGGGLLAHYVVDLPWTISFLFSGLIIVTGPTVIAPILRNVPLKNTVSRVLKWEGILIDPIGALVAVLMYEFIISSEGAHFTLEALQHFIIIGFEGLAYGTLAALALRWLLQKELIPHYLINVFTLAFVLFLFVTSSMLIADSGLLTVMIAGMVLGNIEVPHIKEITYFKESLSVLLISILFILLAANIDVQDLKLLMDPRCMILLALVIFVLRPAAVFFSTLKSTLTWQEKMYVSWVGPRGIVAAGIASLFGLKLLKLGVEGANYITPLVFMVVLGTVLLNATTAKIMARFLGVLLEKSNGILIVGAHKAARLIATYLQDNGQKVALVDNNKANVNYAKKGDLPAYQANVFSDDLSDNIELSEMGYLLALTGSVEVNNHSVEKFSNSYGENGSFRLPSSTEVKNADELMPNHALFSREHDYISMIEIARNYPEIHEVPMEDLNDYREIMSAFDDQNKSIPLLIKYDDKHIKWIMCQDTESNMDFAEGSQFVYMGKKLDIPEKEVQAESEETEPVV